MPSLGRVPALILSLLAFSAAVAAPSAIAQSAGDEQYQDPFEADDGGGTPTKTTPNSSTGSSRTPAAQQPSGSSNSNTTAAPATTAVAPAQAPAEQLARTGTDLRGSLAIGVLLLASGVFVFRWSGSVRD